MLNLMVMILASFVSAEELGYAQFLEKVGYKDWLSNNRQCHASWDTKTVVKIPAGTQMEKFHFPLATDVTVWCESVTLYVEVSQDFEYSKRKYSKNSHFQFSFYEDRPAALLDIRNLSFGAHPNAQQFNTRVHADLNRFLPLNPQALANFTCENAGKEVVVRDEYLNSEIVSKEFLFPKGTKFIISCNFKGLHIYPSMAFTWHGMEFGAGSRISNPTGSPEVMPKKNSVIANGATIDNSGPISSDVFIKYGTNFGEPLGKNPLNGEASDPAVSFRTQAEILRAPGSSEGRSYFYKKRMYKFISGAISMSSEQYPSGSEVWIDPINPHTTIMVVLGGEMQKWGLLMPKGTRILSPSYDDKYFVPGSDFDHKGRKFLSGKAYTAANEQNIVAAPGVHNEHYQSDEMYWTVQPVIEQEAAAGRIRVSSRTYNISPPYIISVLGTEGTTLAYFDEINMNCPKESPLNDCREQAIFKLQNANIGKVLGFLRTGYVIPEYEKIAFAPQAMPSAPWSGGKLCSPREETAEIKWNLNFASKSATFSFPCDSSDAIDVTEKIVSYEKFKDVHKVTLTSKVLYFKNGHFLQVTDVGKPTPVTHRFVLDGEVSVLIHGKRDRELRNFIQRKEEHYDPTDLGC